MMGILERYFKSNFLAEYNWIFVPRQDSPNEDIPFLMILTISLQFWAYVVAIKKTKDFLES